MESSGLSNLLCCDWLKIQDGGFSADFGAKLDGGDMVLWV